jgi:NTP pyrophosphatase (non-canonical NTP hydrolase)
VEKMIKVNEQIVERSIEYYGKDLQLVTSIEECGELIQAISKEIRGKSDINHVAEEVADVLICIEIVKQVCGISDKRIQDWIDAKQERLVRRMKKEL